MADSKMTDITNEVLGERLEGIKTMQASMQATLAGLSSAFVSHEVFELRFRELDLAIKQLDSNIKETSNAAALRIRELDVEIEKLKSRRIVPTIVIATIASVLASAFTYLLYARLQ